MSQGYRISKFEELDQILARVREAHEAEEQAQPVELERRVETSRSSYLLDGPAHRVDLHRAITSNLARGPFKPERLGQSRSGAGRLVVKAEARANDFFGAPHDASQQPAHQAMRPAADRAHAHPSPASPTGAGAHDPALPGWITSERALEAAVDFNEEVLVPNAKNQPTTGAVAAMAPRPPRQGSPGGSPGPATRPPEVRERTSPGFAYPEGGAYMQTYASNLVVESGHGASYVDPHRTQTHIVVPSDETVTSTTGK